MEKVGRWFSYFMEYEAFTSFPPLTLNQSDNFFFVRGLHRSPVVLHRPVGRR